MWNTAWVRKAWCAAAPPAATSARRPARVTSARRQPERRQHRAQVLAVVVSSHAMPTGSASTSRRLTPRSRGRRDDPLGPRPARPRSPCRRRRRARPRPRRRAAPRRAAPPCRATRRAIAAQPVGAVVDGVHRRPSTASSTCAVQMLQVAFSRRMCCSRVCRASRYAGRPPRRRETPTRRPGRWRSSPARDRHVAGVRAAVEHRHAEALRGADHDVGARARPATRAGSGRAGRRRRRPARRARAPPR